MFTYHNFNGYWKYYPVLGVTGEPYISGTMVGVAWLCPPEGGSSSSIDGTISTLGKNAFNDRECSHHFGQGELYSLGRNNVSYSSITPEGHGRSYMETSILYYWSYQDYRTFSFHGAVRSGLDLSCHIPIADHTVSGREYRNITVDVTHQGDGVNKRVSSYDMRPIGGSWKSYTSTSTIQVNPTTKKFRVWYSSGWSEWQGTYRSAYETSSDDYSYPVLTPSDWNKKVVFLSKYFVDEKATIFGDLAVRCADDARTIDMNSLEYLRDIGNFVDDVKDIRSLLGKKTSVKKFAQLYLTYKYGPGLTLQDTLDLFDLCQQITGFTPKHDFSIVRASEERSRCGAAGLTESCNYHYKIYYRPSSNEFLSGIANLQSAGLYPSPKSVWELLPYSFVVDWFADVTSMLDVLDADLQWSTHEVLSTCASVRTVYGSINPNLLGFVGYVGDISVVSYSRQTPSYVYTPVYFSDTPREFKNYVELSALILARGKRT